MPLSAKRQSTLPSSTSPQMKVPKGASIQRHTVPANNSCLFASIQYCLNGVVIADINDSMRKIVADTVLSKPDQYNEAFLGD